MDFFRDVEIAYTNILRPF